MCLQDLQLFRGALVDRIDFAAAGAGLTQILVKDESRIGVLVLGPSAGTLVVRLGGQTNAYDSGSIIASDDIQNRFFSIYNVGSSICEPIWINANSATTATIYVYSLPVDPVNLKRLAETGKW